MFESNIEKNKELLQSTRQELQQAAKTIKELTHELSVQQDYYEKELS